MANAIDGNGEHAVFRQYLEAVGLQGLASAEAVGLHASEWYALSLIDFHGAMSPGELSARTGLTTGATTRLIDRLEKAGFARRQADPNDRRRVIVEPVPDSMQRIEDVVGPARRHVAEVLAHYDDDQRALLFDYFARAAPAFRAASEEIRTKSAGSRRGRTRKGASREERAT
jgi:DNA-binding MarR family transcriptional regulator